MPKRLLVLCYLLLSTHALADVTVTLPNHTTLLLVNGVKASDSGSITVPNGENQLAFRLRAEYRASGDRKLYTSPVQVMTFKAADQSLNLVLPIIRNANNATQFSRNPQFQLTDEKGQNIAIRADQLRHEGLQFGRDYEQEIARYNQGNGKAALTHAVAIAQLPEGIEDNKTSAQNAINAALPPADQNNTPEMAEQMLEFWWQQADKETQQRFRTFINQ